MNIYQIMCLFGFPSLFVTILLFMWKVVRQTRMENKATQLGVQALLRAQMVNDYNKWTARKYAPIYARDNFENCWIQYHALGANGVMDDIRNKFMALPTDPPSEED